MSHASVFFNDSQRVRVWRRRGKRSNSAVTVSALPLDYVTSWFGGAIVYDSTSPLVRIQGTLNAQRYVQNVLHRWQSLTFRDCPMLFFSRIMPAHTLLSSPNMLYEVYRCFRGQRILLIYHQSNTCGMSLDAVSAPASYERPPLANG
ncbi:hypothetical protein TNCV_3146431 [Trichonephila clavipes]|nr:hypothetical protein TNCV_3146431 [Trichonephila clavipes]